MNQCPNNNDGKHRFTYSVGSGMKNDFEPVEYGLSADDTRYRRIEYSVLACQCGQVCKKRVWAED